MIEKQKKSFYKKKGWRLWLVKRLLKDHIDKEEIYSIISHFFENDTNIYDSNDTNINNNDENNENELLKNILKLNDKTVEDVMVPRAEIISISISDSMEKILNTINIETHSRMPVFKNNLDNIMGMIHIKDIIANIDKKNFSLNDIIRDILYVAPSSPVLDLLKRMRKSKIHLGLVVDEHGGVDGLVTIEDLVEEIVGEIEDEHDAEEYEIKIKKINSTTHIFDSSVLLTELEKKLHINLDKKIKNEINTVGGLVFYIAGKMPLKGEKFSYKNGIIFEVISASERRINKIKITIKSL